MIIFGLLDIVRTDGLIGGSVFKSIELIRGDDQDIRVTVRNEAGAAVNITGATPVVFTLRETSESKKLLEKTLGAGIVLTTPASGILTVTIAQTDTEDLIPGEYVYDIELTLAGKKSTVVNGNLVLLADVTHA